MSRKTTDSGTTAIRSQVFGSPGIPLAGGLLLLAVLIVFFDCDTDSTTHPHPRGTTPTGELHAPRGVGPAHRSAQDRPARKAPAHRTAGVLPGIIAHAQDVQSRFERLEAIATLGSSADKRAEVTLLDLLRDTDPEVRDAALESLAELGTPAALDGLALALHDESPLLRQSAIELLAGHGTAGAIDALAVTLQDEDYRVRSDVIHELEELANPAARSLLRQFLADRDPRVRRLAELALQSPPAGNPR